MKNDLNITLGHLHNDQHFQLFVEFGNIVTEFTPAALKVEPMFAEWLIQFKIEDNVLKKIRKSAFTAKIKVADKRRGDTFTGLTEICRIMANRHYSDDVRVIATDLRVVFEAYGNLTRKPLSEKTSAIQNLVKELRDNHSEKIEAADLKEWVDELSSCNNECYQLMQNRWMEDAAKTKVSMKQARAGVDTAYTSVMRRILALQELEGGEIYDSFINRLSAVIASYNYAIAQRQGRITKDRPADDDDSEQTSDQEML